ncbi:MAG: single-stranded DNA-binding protein [Rhodomicrobium sp.]
MRGLETAFLGVLGRDPELRSSKTGIEFCSLNIGVPIGTSDEGKDVLQWVKAVCFGESAKAIAARGKKGARIYIEGALALNEWTDQQGEKRTGIDVRAWKAELVGASSNLGRNKQPRREGQGNAYKEKPQPQDADFNDQMPF